MAKTRRRRPPNRTKRRPPTRDARPRLGGDYDAAPTRTFVSPSRRARRASMLRGAVAGGAALGFLVAVFVIVGGGRGGGDGSSLTARPVTAKVLSPTVKFRTGSGAEAVEMQTTDALKESAIVETDATGMGEFRYPDGSVLRVGPSSTYSLERVRSDSKRRDFAGKVEGGRTWHRVEPGFGESSDYVVAAGLGAEGHVIGTSFAVVCPVENDCFYTVVKGRMRVEDAADRTADLNAGDQVEVKFGRLDPVKHLTEEELAADPWIAQNLTLDGEGVEPPIEETATTLTGETTTTLFGQTTVTGARTGTTSRTVTPPTRSGGGSPPPPPPPPPPATTTPTSPPTTAPPTTAPPTTRTPAQQAWCNNHRNHPDYPKYCT